MAGHVTGGCKKPLLSFRWHHRYWVCDCGKEWIRSKATYGGRKWFERERNQEPRYAKEYHTHDYFYSDLTAMRKAIRDLEKNKKNRKNAVQEGA